MVKKQLQLGETSIVKEKKPSKVKEILSKLSRGLMLPIAVLPIAAVAIGLGSTLSTFDSENKILSTIGSIISTPGDLIFSMLPVFFAIAIAITFTKESGVAGLCAFLGWVVFCAVQLALISSIKDSQGNVVEYDFLWYSFKGDEINDVFDQIFVSNIGITSLSTSVFGGIVVGASVAVLYNKFRDFQLPKVLSFFSGSRFVPIVVFGTIIILSLFFSMFWPLVGIGLNWVGTQISVWPGGLNTFAYATLSRLLIPFGLHHVTSFLVQWTQVGGTFDLSKTAIVEYNGYFYQVGALGETWASIFNTDVRTLNGDSGIQMFLLKYAGQMNSLTPLDGAPLVENQVHLTFDMIFRGTTYANHGQWTFNPGQYTTWSGALMMFALPFAAIAMWRCAPAGDTRKLAGSITLSAAAVSFLTGITEPIEFTFLFIAPVLYWCVHALLTGIIGMTCTIFSVYTHFGPHVWGSCLIEYLSVGIWPDIKGAQGNIWMVPLISLPFGAIYYVIFRWAIVKFDIPTPGRNGVTKLFSKKDYLAKKEESKTSKGNLNQRVVGIIDAYGGKDNITNFTACFTRLRVDVKNPKKVNEAKLKKLGAIAITHPSPKSVHAIVGTEAELIRNKAQDILDS